MSAMTMTQRSSLLRVATITVALLSGMLASSADAAARTARAEPTFQQRQAQAKQQIWVNRLAIKANRIASRADRLSSRYTRISAHLDRMDQKAQGLVGRLYGRFLNWRLGHIQRRIERTDIAYGVAAARVKAASAVLKY